MKQQKYKQQLTSKPSVAFNFDFFFSFCATAKKINTFIPLELLDFD
jgi:hypothetical protein